MAKKKTKKTKVALDREAWINVALQILEDEGVQNISVDRMARELKVTKGSFYHHFQSRSDLLDRLLLYWANEMTANVIRDVLAQEVGPKDCLHSLMEIIAENNLGRYELPIRAWAKHDKTVGEVFEQTYRARFNFVRSLFSDMGFSGDDLAMRAHTFVVYHSWQYSWQEATDLSMSRRQLAKMRELQFEMLCRRS